MADLRQFPNLQTLSLEFDYDFEDYDEWEEEGVNPANNIELGEMIWSKEGQEAWRALMMEAWEAVSQNRDGVVKHLVSLSRFPHSNDLLGAIMRSLGLRGSVANRFQMTKI